MECTEGGGFQGVHCGPAHDKFGLYSEHELRVTNFQGCLQITICDFTGISMQDIESDKKEEELRQGAGRDVPRWF